jgi:hypothetical protein
MATVDQIKRVTIEGRSVGLDKVQRDLKAVSDGQKQVAATAGAMATSTDTASKSALSLASAAERLLQRTDPAYRSQIALQRGTDLLDRALRQGSISAEKHAQGLAALQARFGAVTPAATQAAAAINRTSYAAGQLVPQFNDIATMMMMGSSPFQVMASQAGQISQVLGANGGGLRGAATVAAQAFMSMFNPLNAVLLGIGAVGSAAVAYFSSTKDGATTATNALEAHEALIGRLRRGVGQCAAVSRRPVVRCEPDPGAWWHLAC